jgi:hypothetical protein
MDVSKFFINFLLKGNHEKAVLVSVVTSLLSKYAELIIINIVKAVGGDIPLERIRVSVEDYVLWRLCLIEV